ncbi:cytochrome c oxidase subunit 3 [Algoriphagus jejuensis]|uniref:Cytochrome c oxidase subunit 3 n=1 Tax=Algoriphagus jejuensis TaxID=419934 RepID=A0ABN1MW03_9BACT
MPVNKDTKTWLQRFEALHPYETMLYLGMLGSGLIFLYLTIAFLFGGENWHSASSQAIPVGFLISTVVLIFSGYTAARMRLHYQEENISGVERSLHNTFMLGIIFTILQFAGWKELSTMGVKFTGLPSGSYLYVLSGIHIFHLVGAMIFALILLVQLRKTQGDGVRKLVWITNPFEKMRIRLFTIYWHFMDVVWLLLFLVFIFRF